MPYPEIISPSKPYDDEDPVFQEPWEAQAFAPTIELHNLGVFNWPESSKVLSEEILTSKDQGDPGLGDTYYHYWLRPLEKILILKELQSTEEIDAWIRDYQETPHD